MKRPLFFTFLALFLVGWTECSEMPIGPPITPGSYVTVTPDSAHPVSYASVQAPTATMPVVSADIQAIALVVMNVQNRSVNGTEGGSYAPTTRIIVGGQGIEMSGPFRVDGAGANFFDFDSGNVTMSTLGGFVTGGGFPATFGGLTFFQDIARCNALLDARAGADIRGGLHSIDGSILDGTTTHSAGGTVDNKGRVKFTGIGRIETRTFFGVTTDMDQDITMSMGVQHIQAVISATRKYTMKNTGCTGDETISILNESSATHPLNVFQHDGTTQIAALDSVGSDYIGVELWNDGLGNVASSWHVKSATHKP